MNIKSIVYALVKKFGTRDPYELAASLNIMIIEWDLHHEINGYYKYDRRNKYIMINSNLSEIMKVFVLCHELGHAILHPRTNTPFMRNSTLLSVNKIEKEANTFAVELILSDEAIYQYKDTNMTINEIGGIYGVPEEVTHLKKI
ncbi:ImmA/IrrE family metallo-endopeptidase [Oceanobacillus oncorhynchi]|uniref:ImmA/IrrE family metallo-endopeptidase n=1 Tax=Oceanobacillus oncorhynchi TaxID=545501 RepID=UPI0018677BEB|nr:ImmA/IrrE family metallo-endopeptidase [Oceanobacillus oncorhynchi]